MPRVSRKAVAALQEQIARLISENLRLREQLRQAERERNEVALPALAAALVHAIRTAEEAMAAESSGAVSYSIPELEITLRGYVSAREETVMLEVPRAESGIPSEHLGSIRLRTARIPKP